MDSEDNNQTTFTNNELFEATQFDDGESESHYGILADLVAVEARVKNMHKVMENLRNEMSSFRLSVLNFQEEVLQILKPLQLHSQSLLHGVMAEDPLKNNDLDSSDEKTPYVTVKIGGEEKSLLLSDADRASVFGEGTERGSVRVMLLLFYRLPQLLKMTLTGKSSKRASAKGSTKPMKSELQELAARESQESSSSSMDILMLLQLSDKDNSQVTPSTATTFTAEGMITAVSPLNVKFMQAAIAMLYPVIEDEKERKIMMKNNPVGYEKLLYQQRVRVRGHITNVLQYFKNSRDEAEPHVKKPKLKNV